MCPTLAVTTSAVNGLGMGLTTTAVLIMSNFIIALLRKIIPDGVRIPAFIVIIATFVTIIQLLLQAYIPSLYSSLGIYIPLIVVNCIILGRAEAFASKNGPILSIIDGLSMGLGFTIGLTSIGIFREVLGAGTLFNVRVLPESYEPLTIFILAPGAFFVLAFLTAFMNRIKIKSGKCPDTHAESDCKNCSVEFCIGKKNAESKIENKVKNQDNNDGLKIQNISTDNKNSVDNTQISGKENINE